MPREINKYILSLLLMRDRSIVQYHTKCSMHQNNTTIKESHPCEYCSLGCTTLICGINLHRKPSHVSSKRLTFGLTWYELTGAMNHIKYHKITGDNRRTQLQLRPLFISPESYEKNWRENLPLFGIHSLV